MTESTAVSGFSRWIALRYLFAGQHQYARFISWVSLVGIALGVAVLLLVLSVMNGFDRELTQRILGTVPQVLITDAESHEETVVEIAGRYPEVVNAFPFFHSQAMVTRSSSVSPVVIYGVDAAGLRALPMLADNASVDLIDALGEPRTMVLGAPLARSLGLLLGDSVMVMLTTANASQVKPQFERFVLTGTFQIGAELDYGLALVSLDQMQAPRFAKTGSFGTRLVLNDPYAAPGLAALVAADLTAHGLTAASVSHWGDTYGELFRAVKTEKAMMFVLLVLIVGIASFNVVAGQAMLVNDKRGDIAILRTMGASDGAVLSIFLLQGFLTSLLGVVLGVLLGIALALNITVIVSTIEEFTGARVLEDTYFTEVPSQLLAGDVVAVVLLALGISVIAAFLPARKALAVNPVTALHE